MKTGIVDVDRKIAELLAAAAARYGGGAVERIAASTLSAFEPSTWDDPRQRPTWIHTHGLAARPWWTREQCGRLEEMIVAFERAHEQIIDELRSLDPNKAG